MFHDSSNFCHCGLALKGTPAATVNTEMDSAKLFCCTGKLYVYLGGREVAEVENMQRGETYPNGLHIYCLIYMCEDKEFVKKKKTLFLDCAQSVSLTALIR